MPVKLNSSGGGSVTLDVPVTASTFTATIPAVTGTLVTDAGGSTVQFGAGSASAPSITTTGDTNTGIFFPAADTIAFSEGGTEVMRINASGNVGIGTSSPLGRLDARGAASYFSNSASAYLALNHDGANGAITNNTGGMLFYANGANPIVWHTNGTERGRFHGGGQFSINTTSILGRMSMRWDNAGEQGFGFIPLTETYNGSPVVFYNSSGGLSGFISQSTSSVNYNTSSDYRLKHDVVPLTGSLSAIAALKPSAYKWNADNSPGEGFVAHELAEHIPLAVNGEKDAVNADGSIKPQGVDYSKIVVHLVAAVQELTAKLEAAEARIATLEAR
jgi:hypothetical protein